MKYRVWFNKGNTKPQETWVIESLDTGVQIVASGVRIDGPSNLVVDFKSCPQGWIETEGNLVLLDGQAILEKVSD